MPFGRDGSVTLRRRHAVADDSDGLMALPDHIAERRQQLGRALASIRTSAKVKQIDLSRRTGYSRASISNVEQGRQFPARTFWEVADETLGARGDLVSAYDQVCRAEAQDRWEEDDVNRRALLALAGGAASAPIAERLEHARRGIDDALIVEPSGRDADAWSAVTDDYAQRVGLGDPSALLPSITADFADLTDRIATATDKVRARLVESAANLAALTAIALVTMRQYDAAGRWWRTAARAAAEVGDAALQTRVSGKQAVMALYSAPLDRVLALADRTLAFSKGRPSAGVLAGEAARTQALARLGRDGEALEALSRLADLYDGYGGDTAHTQWGWTEQRLRFVTSEVHAFGGRTRETAIARGQALRLYPSTSWAAPAQVEAHMSIAHIRAGDVDGGMAHLLRTLDQLRPWQRADAFVARSAGYAVGSIDKRPRQLQAGYEVRALLQSGS